MNGHCKGTGLNGLCKRYDKLLPYLRRRGKLRQGAITEFDYVEWVAGIEYIIINMQKNFYELIFYSKYFQ